MNYLSESNMATEDAVIKDNGTDDSTRNLLKLEQLSKLGLCSIFSDKNKCDKKSGDKTLQLNLPRKETENSDSLQDKKSSDSGCLRSLSPVDENVKRINKFSEFNAILTDKKDQLPNQTPKNDINMDHMYINIDLNDDEVSETQVDLIQKNFESNDTVNRKNFIDSLKRKFILDGNNKKKIRIQKLKKVQNPKIRVFYKDNNFSNINEEKMVKNGSVGGTRKILFKTYEENADLENKINDSLLDILEENLGKSSINSEKCPRKEDSKVKKENMKFITIQPSKPGGKIINLMIKGKTCRSKQPLTDMELRLVTKILGQENLLERSDNFYKNVYYDADSDTNFRYEVKKEPHSAENNDRRKVLLSEENHKAKKETFLEENKPKKKPHSEEKNNLSKEPFLEKNNDSKNSNAGTKTERGISKEQSDNEKESNKKEKYVPNSIARTRFGRICRPSRHVKENYRRFEHLTNPNSDAGDENSNFRGYVNYRMVHEGNALNIPREKPVRKTSHVLHGPVESRKRKFSSLSLCPTCGKIYLGYTRMIDHFQKYPEHKDEQLLVQLLNAKKKSYDDRTLFDGADVNSNEEVASPQSNSGTFKKNRKKCRKNKMQDSKNANELKKLLSNYGIQEIIKCIGPAIARVLDSWQYLVMRSKQLKKNKETLITTLLREISSILKHIRSLSHYILRPYEGNKENVHKFAIEEEDILQYVLGVTPGTYLISNDDKWLKTSPSMLNGPKIDKFKTKNETSVDSSNLEEENLCMLRNSSTVPYEITIPEETLFCVDDINHDTETDPLNDDSKVGISSFVNSNGSFYGTFTDNTYQKGSHDDEALAIFRNLKDPSESQLTQSNMQLENVTSDSVNDNSKLEYVSDFDDKTFCSSHSLRYDSYVHSSDFSNNFPVSATVLPDPPDSKTGMQLLQTSSAGDILNNFKNIDNSAESAMDKFQNVANIPTSSNRTPHLSTSFDEETNSTSTETCLLDFTSLSSQFP